MKTQNLPQFEDTKFDFEYDLGERGGLLRFRSVKDAQTWVKTEVDFWNLIRSGSASNYFQRVPRFQDRFFEFPRVCDNTLRESQQLWESHRRDETNLLKQLEASPDNNSLLQQIDSIHEKANTTIERLRNQLKNSIQTHIFNQNSYFMSAEPEAQFVAEIAKENPTDAVYTLHQLLSYDTDTNEDITSEYKGRVLGVLFSKNLNRKVRPDNVAFKKAISSWKNELGSYKADYEDLKTSFQSTANDISEASNQWNERTVEMEDEFSEQLKKNDEDLKNLTEVYESHMTLAAPKSYWNKKMIEHGRGIQRLKKWMTWTSLFGLVVIAAAGYFLLPEFYPSKSIPWRNLGIFALVSTFVLWFIRMQIKLFLSHIHLHADANERVVMIQTFMALMRHKDSREALSKEDIALVLAPIFKPSTTGVIKDDGGPVTLTDFIGRLGKS